MADRYWVGGTGNWNDTAKWSATSGGAGGASVPTFADNAYFDGASDTGAAFTVTVTGTNASFTASASGTVLTVTAVASGTITVGSVVYIASTNVYNVIASLGTGTGGTGTYNLRDSAGTVSSGAWEIPLAVNDLIIGNGTTVTVLDQTMTLAGSARLVVAGSLFFPAANLTRTYTGAIAFSATTTGKTITTNGIQLTTSNIFFDGVGGEWTLGSALSIGVSADIALTNGSLITANYNITAKFFNSNNSNVRSLTLGSSTINLGSSNIASGINFSSTNFTFDCGTSQINLNSALGSMVGSGLTFNSVTTSSTGSGAFNYCSIGGGMTFSGTFTASRGLSITASGNTFNGKFVCTTENQGYAFFTGLSGQTFNGDVELNNTSSTTFVDFQFFIGSSTFNADFILNSLAGQSVVISASHTFNNFKINRPTNSGTLRFVYVYFQENQTISGTFTIDPTNTSITRRYVIYGQKPNLTPSELTVNAIDFGYGIDFRHITASGISSPWDVSSKSGGNCGGNTNITFASPKTVYWNLGGSQNWNATAWATTPTGTPSAANFPLAQDTAVITESGAAGTITINERWSIGTLTFNDGSNPRTSAATLNFSDAAFFYDDLKLSSGTVISGGGGVVFSKPTSIQNVTTAGKLFLCPINIEIGSGSLVFQDNFSTTGILYFNRGNINLNGKTFLVSKLESSNVFNRSIAFNGGKIQISGDAQMFNMDSCANFSYTGISEIEFTYSGSNTRYLFFGGSTPASAIEANALNMTFSAGSGIIDFPAPNRPRSVVNNLIFLDGFTGRQAAASGSGGWNQVPTIFGNVILPKNGTAWSNNGIYLYSGSKQQSITFQGPTFYLECGVTGPASVVIQNNGTVSSIGHVSGTLNLNGKVVTAASYSSSNSNQRNLIFGSGQLNLTGSGTVWEASTATNMTVTPGTGKIVLSNNTNTARTFNGGGVQTYPEVEIGGDTGTATTTFTGANRFVKLSNAKAVAYTIVFPNATTKVDNWNINGSSGNLVTLSRTGGSGTFTLEYTGNQYAIGRYLSISNSAATPTPNRWFAVDSTNGGSNTGWVFDAPRFAQFIPFFGL